MDNTDKDDLHPCENCGHDEVVHYHETGRDCWEGNGHGNTCPCPDYIPDANAKVGEL